MGQFFDVGHVAQLHEIQRARLACGESGIGPEVEELISRLTSGGVGTKRYEGDLRRVQAKCLWDKGFGRESGTKSFKAYLASIPEIPESLRADDPELPLLSLADPRPGLVNACRLIGVKYAELGYSDGDVVPFDERHSDPTEPFWFRHDDGRRNRNRRPDHCHDKCVGDILSGTAMVGIFAYLHHPQIVKMNEHTVDLPGSVRSNSRFYCACLKVWKGQTKLLVYGHSVNAGRDCGALRFRRK